MFYMMFPERLYIKNHRFRKDAQPFTGGCFGILYEFVTYRDVLTRRYILKQSTEEVAKELNYSESHTKRLKRQALERFGREITNHDTR